MRCIDAVFDLFSALEANDAQLDFPTLFASSKQGWAAESLEAERVDLAAAVRSHCAARAGADGR